jgi:Spy/CpxP family protein refolding chaperone
MYPGFMGWWHGHQRGEGFGHGAHAHCGHGGPGGFGRRGFRGGHEGPEGAYAAPFGHDDDAGAFGVRRPLRFLAHKLELEDAQVAELAAILSELKTERAQAAVDYRRSTQTFAAAAENGTFDEEKANQAGQIRVESAERLRQAVVKAIGRIHATLDDEQRKQFAYLLRTGTLQI